MAQVAAQPRPRVRPRLRTWRFDLTLQLPAFSSAEDVRLIFLDVLEDAQDNRSIPGFHTMCPKMAELHTFPDICAPQSRLVRPLSKDGCSTLQLCLTSRYARSWLSGWSITLSYLHEAWGGLQPLAGPLLAVPLAVDL